jgi:hypothetical protein
MELHYRPLPEIFTNIRIRMELHYRPLPAMLQTSGLGWNYTNLYSEHLAKLIFT